MGMLGCHAWTLLVGHLFLGPLDPGNVRMSREFWTYKITESCRISKKTQHQIPHQSQSQPTPQGDWLRNYLKIFEGRIFQMSHEHFLNPDGNPACPCDCHGCDPPIHRDQRPLPSKHSGGFLTINLSESAWLPKISWPLVAVHWAQPHWWPVKIQNRLSSLSLHIFRKWYHYGISSSIGIR